MVLKTRLLERCFPFLIALALLISLIPAVPVSAASYTKVSLGDAKPTDAVELTGYYPGYYAVTQYSFTDRNQNDNFYYTVGSGAKKYDGDTYWSYEGNVIVNVAFCHSQLYTAGGTEMFFVSDLCSSDEDLLQFSCSFSSSTSGQTATCQMYLYFYASDGSLIDSVSTSQSYSGYSNNFTSLSVITQIPDNAVYFLPFVKANCNASSGSFSFLFYGASFKSYKSVSTLPAKPSVFVTSSTSFQYDQGAVASPMAVSASVTDGGSLTYQWYENTSNNTTYGTVISGATSASYTPSTSSGGTKYYYCVVTNTVDPAISTTKSSVFTVKVTAPAETPTFDVNLSDTYDYSTDDDTATPLSVSASVTDGGTLSYQWYVNSTNSTSGGTAISGATSATYTPAIGSIGTKYYYCRVTNTLGSLTASAYSNVAAVVVAEPTFYVSGYYEFESDLLNCYDFYLDIPGGTTDDSVTFTSVNFDRYSLVFNLSQGNAVTAWTLKDGWILEQFKTIYFDGEEKVSESVYGSFLSATYSVRDASGDLPYLTTLSFDGVEYHFFDYLGWSDGYPNSPEVTVSVLSDRVVMTYGIVTKVWTYPGEGEFAGLSLYPDGSDPFPVGTSGTLPGTTGDHTDYVVYSVETKQATFVIGDQSYVFFGTVSSTPEITMDVLEGGVRLYDGTTSYFFEHDATVVGYKLSPDADTYIGIGESYIFAGSDTYSQTLYPIYSTDVEFFTSVNIYDSSGTKLLGSYDFATLGAAPAVSLTVLGNGCKLVFGDTVYSWTAGPTRFYGFSPAMYVAEPYYVPGNAYTLPGGEPVNLTIDLYVHDTENSGLPALDFVEWLKVAVGGFMDFEIFPSLSLDEILYFILVVRLLLWFLEVIK